MSKTATKHVRLVPAEHYVVPCGMVDNDWRFGVTTAAIIRAMTEAPMKDAVSYSETCQYLPYYTEKNSRRQSPSYSSL